MALRRSFLSLLFSITLNHYASSQQQQQMSNTTATNICLQKAENALASFLSNASTQAENTDMALCTEYMRKKCNEDTNSPFDLSNCLISDPATKERNDFYQHVHHQKRATDQRPRRHTDIHYHTSTGSEENTPPIFGYPGYPSPWNPPIGYDHWKQHHRRRSYYYYYYYPYYYPRRYYYRRRRSLASKSASPIPRPQIPIQARRRRSSPSY